MVFIIPLVIGCLIGFIRGGNIWAIAQLKLDKVWLLPLAYFIQYISIYYVKGFNYEILVMISYITLLGFCLLNMKIDGIKIVALGIVSNALVMTVNHLRMPAYLPAVEKMDPAAVPLLEMGKIGKSIAMTQHTHMNFLGDIFAYSIGKGGLVSIGDILFGIGIAIVIQHAMCLERTNRANGIAS